MPRRDDINSNEGTHDHCYDLSLLFHMPAPLVPAVGFCSKEQSTTVQNTCSNCTEIPLSFVSRALDMSACLPFSQLLVDGFCLVQRPEGFTSPSAWVNKPNTAHRPRANQNWKRKTNTFFPDCGTKEVDTCVS